MLFVLSSKRTDLEALLCCVATVQTNQPVGFTSQVTFLLPYTAAPRHLCSPPWLTEAMRHPGALTDLGWNVGGWRDRL